MIPKKIRKMVIRRDNGLCQLCGSPATSIHHIILGGMGRKRNHAPENLILLCSFCHNACHTGKRTQEYQQACIRWSRKRYGNAIDIIQEEKWRGKDAGLA